MTSFLSAMRRPRSYCNELTFLIRSAGRSSNVMNTPGSLKRVAPLCRNVTANSVLPQPAAPQMRVGRPAGRPPAVSSSSPSMPVGALGIPPAVLPAADCVASVPCKGLPPNVLLFSNLRYLCQMAPRAPPSHAMLRSRASGAQRNLLPLAVRMQGEDFAPWRFFHVRHHESSGLHCACLHDCGAGERATPPA